jgi:hypothetical protein
MYGPFQDTVSSQRSLLPSLYRINMLHQMINPNGMLIERVCIDPRYAISAELLP